MPTLTPLDLTSLFDWNTKQLFLYVDASYTSADGTANTVVVWDRIVRRKEDAKVKTRVTAKYPIKDMSKSLQCVHSVSLSFYCVAFDAEESVLMFDLFVWCVCG